MRPDGDEKFSDFLEKYWPADADMPKHERLRNAIKSSINEGFWVVGGRLPTERDWVAATPCSLGTVQRALRELVAEGVIERRRGSGTVVAELTHPMEEPWHIRFFADKPGAETYLPVFTSVVDRQLTVSRGAWSAALGQRKGQKVVRIDRIFENDQDVQIYAVFYALAGRFPELVETPVSFLNGVNLKKMMANRHHVPVHRVRQTLRFEPAPDWVREKCDWPGSAHATVLNVVALSLDGEAMYYQDFYIPPIPQVLDLGMSSKA